jgi:hypothetical protein
MPVIITEETLSHYGIRGMRWGKRKNGVSTAKIATGGTEEKADGTSPASSAKARTATGKAAIKNTLNKPKLEFDDNWADGIDPKDAAMMKKFIEDEYYGNVDVRML